VLRAEDVGVTGYEDRETLDASAAMKARVEAIRLQAGLLMNLGDVREKSVPKMMLVAAPRDDGAITVRSLIPHRVHASIGVLGAVSVATACLVEGSPAKEVARVSAGRTKTIGVEHPGGVTECVVTVDDAGQPIEAGMLRTARKLMDGVVFG
jgi:4-oxalomesaconate tautomerase